MTAEVQAAPQGRG